MAFQTLVGHGVAHGMFDILKPATTGVEYIANAAFPIQTPKPEQLIHLAMHGWLSEDLLQPLCRMHGVSINPKAGMAPVEGGGVGDGMASIWNRMYFASQELPTTHEYLVLSNRFGREDPDVAAGLRRWGFYGEEVRKEMANLRYEIPSSADLVRFSIRHVFEPDLIANLGFDKEFNCTLDFWHKMQGLNYQIFSGPFKAQYEKFISTCPPEQQIRDADYKALDIEPPTWARAFWWSHWVLPSPTQGYLMWQRLNPNRDRRYDAPEMVGQNFTFGDLDLLLRGSDYPPKYRPLLAAISRPIPGIRFAREFRRTGVYDFKDLLNWAERQGYGPKDAEDIATNIDRWAIAAEKKKGCQIGCAQIKKLLNAGVLSEQEAVGELVQMGEEETAALMEVSFWALEQKADRAAKVIATLRKQFLRGVINADQVRGALRQFGIQAGRIEEYIADWQLEKQTDFKQISAVKAQQWACKGLIDMTDFEQRLVNLGYTPSDQAPLLQEAKNCQATLLARAAAEQQKILDKLKRDNLAAQKALAQALKEAQRQLASHGSPAQLRKWFCEGNIGISELSQRLTFLGWPPIDITRLISDCKSAGTGTSPTGGSPGGGPAPSGSPPP